MVKAKTKVKAKLKPKVKSKAIKVKKELVSSPLEPLINYALKQLVIEVSRIADAFEHFNSSIKTVEMSKIQSFTTTPKEAEDEIDDTDADDGDEVEDEGESVL